MRILGIDPGLRNLGWGIIDLDVNKLSYVGCGVICTKAPAPLSERLELLYNGLTDILDKYHPDEVSVEYVFVNKDAQATLKLGHARGICLLAPAQRGLNITEYAPNQIKKTVIGVGHAQKEQVRFMVKRLLPRAILGGNDSSDALAIALCHAYHMQAKKSYNLKERLT